MSAPSPATRQPWQVMLGGICTLILTIGIARFAYTPLLPLMQAQAGLSDAAGGWLATANYLGYMSGALLAASLSSLPLKFKLYRAGVLLALVSTVCMALTQDLTTWALLRYVAGLSSAAGMLLASGLVLNWLMRHGHRAELGIHFSGIGLGIIVSGVVVMLLNRLSLDWATQWQVFAALGLLLAWPAWAWVPPPAAPATPGPPRPVSPSATSQATTQATSKATSQGSSPAPALSAAAPAAPSAAWMRLMLAMYFCAGFGFVISATFTVAIAARQSSLAHTGGLAWVMVGLAAVPAVLAWDRIARGIGDLPALLWAFAAQTLSVLLPAFSDRPAVFLAAALLYGGSFIGIVSLTLALVGRAFPANPAKAMARLTLSYGVAQVLAPALAGQMAQASGSYRGALLLTAAVMGVGIGLLVVLRARERRRA
ncbi:MAG: YbfB/YjiJ family MFS transporter [Burkholderiaceae bacterium]|nr:YbfB/YjiJ family MFS transporter [Burkholderiaceae bacterium]